MIFHPAIIALLLGSLLTGLMLLYSSYYGIRILRHWDIRSGSELQLGLERRTYLISTVMSYAFGFQLLSLFLFIFTADTIHSLFVGAMCAAGTLNVNEFGYPTIIIKGVNFLLAGLWLILNHTDNRAFDYPLIRKKYILLIAITPLVLAEAALQAAYFLSLKPDVITSCCGALFTTDREGISSSIASLPRIPMKVAFYTTMALTVLTGAVFYLRGRGVYFFSLLSTATFFISIAALISFICLYFYELPTHHCPFCILQKEYGYVGYFLYVTLLGGGVSGMGVGMIMPFRKIGSLSQALPQIQRKLALTAVLLFSAYALIATYQIVFSDFILEGY